MKIGIVGCAGRMGRMLISEVLATDGCEIGGGIDQPGSPDLGRDLGSLVGRDPIGVAVSESLENLFAVSDVVTDFTIPESVFNMTRLAVAHETALVCGTTGLEVRHMDAIRDASSRVPVVQAFNMSIGINLLLGLAKQVAGILGPDYDIEIVEMHHRHKVDAPSGTALAIGRAAAEGRGVDLDDVSQRVRDGHTGPRRRGDIGFATLRGGDVIGDHSLVFAAEGERIELAHRASSRGIYARGAVRAALWTRDRPAGLYSMRDVLGFD